MFDPTEFASIEDATRWVYGVDGPLVARGFEIRESQVQLSLAIARAIDANTAPAWVLGEAPCGTGKGMAYLIPGVIASLREERIAAVKKANGQDPGQFKKLVVSTANIALQGQLVNKDIPGVASILGVEVRASLYKGKNNYLCRSKIQEESLGFRVKMDPIRQLIEWSKEADCSGDREDLMWDPGQAWNRLSVGSDQCHSRKCPFFRGNPLCFAEEARYGAQRAHVIIINHHLLAMMPRAIPSVLLAVDEGHELENCLRQAASAELSDRTPKWLGARVRNLLDASYEAKLVEPLTALFTAMDAYLQEKEADYTEPLPEGWADGRFDAESLELLVEVQEAIGRLVLQKEDSDESGKLEKFAETIGKTYMTACSLADGLPHHQLTGGSDSPWAVWASIRTEKGPKGAQERRLTGNIAPADIMPTVQSLQRRYPTCVITSATLAVGGTLEYLRNTLGLGKLGQPAKFGKVKVQGEDGAPVEVERQLASAGPLEELILPSPYPIERMGALVVPADVLNPKDARWKDWATDKVLQAVELARGRTLVLASSSAMMKHYGMHLGSRSSYPVRTQGSSGRNDLIRWFTETTEGVLVATRSFFQGLDVRGESLSCVIIDRVPFDPPGDPLEDTVANMLAERVGGNPFSVRSLPRAGMVLAQASGRLIRSQADRGVVVMLDSKVVDGMMAGFLRRSFGGLPLSRSMSDIGRVIDGQSVTVEPQPAAQAGRSLRRNRG